MIKKNIVFIDNTDHWKGDMDRYSKSVEYIRVPNTSSSNTGTPKNTSSSNTASRYTIALAKSGNRYASTLLNISPVHSENFMNKGLNRKVANRLKKWSKSQETKYALFDFDGTIIASEGFSLDALRISQPMNFTSPMMDFLLPTFYARGGTRTRTSRIRLTRTPALYSRSKTRKNILPKKPSKSSNFLPLTPLEEMVESQYYQNTLIQPLRLPSKEFLDDMFVYLIRPDRVEILRDLFRTLLSNGVQIRVFTQNPYASTANPYRKIFIEMLWRIFNQDSENGLVVNMNESSSQYVSMISREDLDSMLHSTIDYTEPGEPALKRNIMRGVFGTSTNYKK